jgi:succinate dehydrogenase / fumarate reductase, cytochrome b subunit
MPGALTLYQTTVGKKVVMAVTGLILVAYVILHMVGNLKVFQGPEKLNEYAVFLREAGGPLFFHEQGLWTVRVILLASFVLHIWAAYQLTRADWAARPVRYSMRRPVQQSYASRTLRWGGVILALFVVYHILHLTTGTVHPSFREGDVYLNLVAGFRVIPVSLFYIAAMVALGFHIQHGFWSMGQTLGLKGASNDRAWQILAFVIAWAVALGNISIPLAVMLGIVR